MRSSTIRSGFGAVLLLLIPGLSGCLAPEDGSDEMGDSFPTTIGMKEVLVEGPVFEPHLAQGADSPRLVTIALKAGSSGFRVLQSTDAGGSWNEQTLEPDESMEAEAWTHFGDPVVAYAGDRAWVGGIGHHRSSHGPAYVAEGRDIVLAASGERGFEAPTTVWTGDGVSAGVSGTGAPVAWNNGDKPWFDVGVDGRFHAVWVAIRGYWGPAYGTLGNALMYASSVDGLLWGEPEVVAEGSPRMPVVDAAQDGTVRIAWSTFGSSDSFLATSNGGGWKVKELPALAGQPYIVETRQPLLVAPLAVDGGSRLALIELDGSEVEPTLIGEGSQDPWGVVMGKANGAAVDLGWYVYNGQESSFHVARYQEGELSPALMLDDGLPHRPQALGDYVQGIVSLEKSTRYVWSAGERGLVTQVVEWE